MFIDHAGKDHFRDGGKLPRAGFCGFWVVGGCRAWDSAIFGRWTAAARGILQFLGGELFLRVRFSLSRAMDHYRAWDSPILER